MRYLWEKEAILQRCYRNITLTRISNTTLRICIDQICLFNLGFRLLSLSIPTWGLPENSPLPRCIECEGLFFCRNNGWIMESIEKGLIVPKRVLINQLNIPQMPQNLYAQFVCPSSKVLDFNEKKLHWKWARVLFYLTVVIR